MAVTNMRKKIVDGRTHRFATVSGSDRKFAEKHGVRVAPSRYWFIGRNYQKFKSDRRK